MSQFTNMGNKAMTSKNAGRVRNAGNYVGYLLRGGETGLVCCTEIMENTRFLEQLETLLQQQKADFQKEVGSSLDYWKSRDFDSERAAEVAKMAANPSHKPKDLDRAEHKRNGLVRKDAALQSKPWRVRGRTGYAQTVTNIAHKISVTQIVEQVQGRTGHQVVQPLPNGATKEQILHVLRAMRDAVPKEYPAVFTVHKDLDNHNLHIQGWISSKDWNYSKGDWAVHSRGDTRHFESKEAPAQFNQVCEKAMAEVGLSFKHAKDATLPRITDTHPYVQVLLKTRSREDFITGKVKDGVVSERVRAICDQIGARLLAIEAKEQQQFEQAEANYRFFTGLDDRMVKTNTQKEVVLSDDAEVEAELAADAESMGVTVDMLRAVRAGVRNTKTIERSTKL